MDTTAQFLDELRTQAKAEEPAEKAKAVADMARTAKELEARGSDFVEGRGQAIGSIPARIYFRWNNMLPGCWRDKQFVAEFLKDNPQCCAPGFKPRPSELRHGVTFSGGSFYKSNKHLV